MDGQQLVTLLIAAAASWYLVRRGLASLRGKGSGCGSCAKCSSPADEDRQTVRKQLYSLGPGRKSV
jgi:hypothetical protein